MTPQDPGVYISPAQTYQEVRSLAAAMIRIETKLDQLGTDSRALRTDLADHETRLRALERARWPLPTIGALAGVGGAIAGIIALYH